MATKAELKCYIALLENERKKASRKALLAEQPSVRVGWEHIGLALRCAIELMRREAEK